MDIPSVLLIFFILLVPATVILVPRWMRSRERQRILLTARTDEPATPLWFLLDGKRFGPIADPHEFSWPLEPGAHTLLVESPHGRSDPVRFRVD